jgi:phenylalanyl-tRNA synthetase beta chain
MRVPVSWLREYVAVELPLPELAERLAISTAEVDTIERRGVPDADGNLGLFRVGHVLEAGKHPNADRLQLCRVDIGDGEPRQIVCGAWNFGAGAKVAVALDGAVLPDGLKLERRKLRGEVSEGMILSERELELSAEHGGILVLPDDWETGTPLADVLPLVEDVLVIEPTGNRPDLFSVYGIAREVAALCDLPLAPFPGVEPERAGDEPVDVRVEDLDGCPRYVGRLLRDVRVAASPPWLKARLTAAGMRPISNVVDVTNYVMLALGSPLHAFDFDTLADGRVVVRRARPGEEIRTLDGTLRPLDPRDLLIADAERPIAIAGIMGGEETEVRDTTTTVLLEAANFEPTGILASSERLRLRTEGSNRWEKGVDPHVAEHAARLATQLFVELGGARWTGAVDVQGALLEGPEIRLRPERTNAVVGLAVPAEEQHAILRRLGCEVEDGDVRAPTWRARDLTREIDLVEEVARFHLDEIPFTLPTRSAMFGRLTLEQRVRRLVEEVLVGVGYSETYTPSLVPVDADGAAVRLAEPLTVEQAALRTRLLPSLVDAVRRNVEVGNRGAALFEIARVYEPTGMELPRERWHVAGVGPGGLAAARRAVEELYAALKLEPAVERGDHELLHPGRSAETPHGALGELRPGLLEEGRWGAFELDLDALAVAVPERLRYEDLISYPALRQDLAFVVPDAVTAGELAAAMQEAAGPELREVRVFDEYRSPELGEGRRSLAFAVAFQSPDRTLTDEDAAGLRRRLVEALGARFGAELRA